MFLTAGQYFHLFILSLHWEIRHDSWQRSSMLRARLAGSFINPRICRLISMRLLLSKHQFISAFTGVFTHRLSFWSRLILFSTLSLWVYFGNFVEWLIIQSCSFHLKEFREIIQNFWANLIEKVKLFNQTRWVLGLTWVSADVTSFLHFLNYLAQFWWKSRFLVETWPKNISSQF